MSDEELAPGDVLAESALAPAAGRGVPESLAGHRSAVRCGRPLVYPVPPADLPPALRGRPGRYVGALFAFDLDPLPPGARYTGARFEVTLADPGGRAVLLAVDGDELGLIQDAGAAEPASAVAVRTVAAARTRPGWLRRLAGRRDAPRAWTTGVLTPAFGWVYDDPRGDLLLPRSYGMHALLEVPGDHTGIAGRLAVAVEIDGVAGRQKAAMAEAVEFAEPLIPAEVPTGAAVRLCMAADVVGYSRRGNAEAELLQRDLVGVLARARRAAGIPDSMVVPQPQGDGQFTVLPVGIDESAVIPRLLAELGAGLTERDRDVPEQGRMRLRVALHRGLVKEADNGWVGSAAIAVHRILDSPPLRAAVGEHPAAVYVLGIPDVLYRDVIVHAVEPPGPDDFRPMTVDLPAKDFVEHGWLAVGPAVTG
jgi:hypothetical protein